MTKEEIERIKTTLEWSYRTDPLSVNMVKQLIAEIERLQSEREWRPIETVPDEVKKIGTRILVFGSRMNEAEPFKKPPKPEVYEVIWWRAWYGRPEPGWMMANCDEEYGDYIDATLWQPLPDSPEGGKE